LNQRLLEKIMRENPDGHEGSGATRKIGAKKRGLRTGILTKERMRERSPSKVTVRQQEPQPDRQPKKWTPYMEPAPRGVRTLPQYMEGVYDEGQPSC